jgi:hypothetical protein
MREEALLAAKFRLMRMRLRILCFGVILTALCAAKAEEFTYVTNQDTITITGYTGPGGNLLIPAAIHGLAVKSIGRWAFSWSANLGSVTIPEGIVDIADYAFYNATGLQLVNIPNTVTNIGDAAFFHCSNLSSLLLPNSLKSIGDNTFAQCSNLSSVALPGSLSSIGVAVFYDCINLSAITIDANNAFYSSVNGVLFNKDLTRLVEFPPGQGQSYAVPDGVRTIGDSAFYTCSGLTNVSIPNSVTNIENFAFHSCSALSDITLPNGLISIGTVAFAYCHGLTGMSIPASVQFIGSGPFANCGGLESIDVDVSNANYTSIKGVLFDELQTALLQYPAGRPGSYTIPNTVESIQLWAFTGARLTDIEISDGVTVIPYQCFLGCDLLASVRLPSSLTEIDSMAFDYCYSLVNVTIPGSVAYIGDFAFQACPELAGVYFGGNAPRLGQNVFSANNNATLYYLPGYSGWMDSLGDIPAVLWNPQIQTSSPDFGVVANQFGFTITGTKDIPIVVEASAAVPSTAWVPLQTCTLTNGSLHFSDPTWRNYPTRLYRIRSP